MPGNDVFPNPHGSMRLSFDYDPAIDPTVFDVKFYPYATVDDDQIFALVAADSAVILRPKPGCDPPFEYVRWFRDEQRPRACYNSLAWAKDPRTKKPILCIAGSEPNSIKILDVESGNPLRTLAGHGRAINDLAISPLSPSLLASASNDNTIRLWSLGDQYQDQPCVALFAGEGHKSHVLVLHFHPNGRWLLSGGVDTAVCLWAVPSLEELSQHKSDDDSQYRDAKIVYYPHFFSQEVHPNYVDSLAFYGDLIISKAAREPEDTKNEILIWKIEGFESDLAVPSEPPIPVPGEKTRSSFPHDARFHGFQRLLTLESPNTARFYHRFSLLHAPGMRPIIAMGNEQSTCTFWDLARLQEGIDPKDRPKDRLKKKAKSKAGTEKDNSLSRHVNGLQSAGNGRVGTPSSFTDLSTTSASVEREYTLSDPFKPLAPHYKKTVDTKLSKNMHFATSQIAFSPDGTWMVGVGDHGMVYLFHRDNGVIGDASPQSDGG